MDFSKENTKQLILAISNAIRSKGSSVGKTKLIKFLYLADIAYYRAKGVTLTGFNWKFHFYGPWAEEFDNVLSEMEQQGSVAIIPWAYPEGEAQLVNANVVVELENVIDSLEAQHELKMKIDCFAHEKLGALLDFVYFETEPMENAERNSDLDFSKVDRSVKIRPRKKTSSGITKEAIRQLRSKLSPPRPPDRTGYTEPNYDEEYHKLISSLDSDD